MAALLETKPQQIRYAIKANGRDQVWPDLTETEASEMLAMGFRFSVFEPGDYRLSIPYAIMRMIDRDELVLIQDV